MKKNKNPLKHAGSTTNLTESDLAVYSANTTWISARGVWLMYIALILGARLFFGIVFRMRPALSWTLCNVAHAACTFMALHWNKGLPFQEVGELQSGELRSCTFWEQLCQTETSNAARKFLLAVPIVLYIVSMNYCQEADSETFLLFNTICSMAVTRIQVFMFLIASINTGVVIVAKLDFMNGVRIFGINQE